MQALIYKIENLVDGKVYVGSTINHKNRWRCHRTLLRAGTHHCRYLQFAWNKYGEESFSPVIVDRCDVEKRAATEQHWIDLFKAADPAFGYNACPVAMSCASRKHSAETRKKIGLAHAGRAKSELHRARLSEVQRSRTASEETRLKLSKALLGKKRTPEQIQRAIEARRGFRHSEETKAQFSEIAKKRPPPSEDTRRKLAKASAGRTWTAETRRKIAAYVAPPRSDESRQQQSATMGGRPFTVTAPDGAEHHFNTLSEAVSLGLDSSNVHKCLIGKAKQTKGHRCQYDAPHAIREI